MRKTEASEHHEVQTVEEYTLIRYWLSGYADYVKCLSLQSRDGVTNPVYLDS